MMRSKVSAGGYTFTLSDDDILNPAACIYLGERGGESQRLWVALDASLGRDRVLVLGAAFGASVEALWALMDAYSIFRECVEVVSMYPPVRSICAQYGSVTNFVESK